MGTLGARHLPGLLGMQWQLDLLALPALGVTGQPCFRNMCIPKCAQSHTPHRLSVVKSLDGAETQHLGYLVGTQNLLYVHPRSHILLTC